MDLNARPQDAKVFWFFSSEKNIFLSFYLRRLFGFEAASHAPVQDRTACSIATDCCLAIAALAALRPRPAAAFAPLSHMLRKGFFLVQGFAIREASRVTATAVTALAVTLRDRKRCARRAFADAQSGLQGKGDAGRLEEEKFVNGAISQTREHLRRHCRP